MSVTLHIPLDIPEIRLLSTERTEAGELLRVEMIRLPECLDVPLFIVSRDLDQSQIKGRVPVAVRAVDRQTATIHGVSCSFKLTLNQQFPLEP